MFVFLSRRLAALNRGLCDFWRLLMPFSHLPIYHVEDLLFVAVATVNASGQISWSISCRPE